MFPLWMILLVFTCQPSFGIRVLSSGRDVKAHNPDSGAELLHSSLAGQDTVTICARFLAYQFTHHGYGAYPEAVLLKLQENGLLASMGMTSEKSSVFKQSAGEQWLNGNVLLGMQFNKASNWQIVAHL